MRDKAIRELNLKYAKIDAPTDVLAFNLSFGGKSKDLFADIVVSVDTAIRQAREFKTTPAYELNLYSIHGILHILGYDDHNFKDKKKMRQKESIYADS